MQSDDYICLIFWNIHKHPEAFESVARLASTHAASIFLIAEMPGPNEPGLTENPTVVLQNNLNQSLSPSKQPKFELISKPSEKRTNNTGSEVIERGDVVQVYAKLPKKTRWVRETTHDRYVVWRVAVPGRRIFHLAAAHFTAIQNDQGDGQRECAIALRTDLEQVEQKLYTRSSGLYEDGEPLSIVMGDLNANPFDAGITGIYGLNATGIRDTAREGIRNHQGREYPYLFNPMWQFLTEDPPGTYYNRISAPVRFDWFLLDQTLVRPGLLELFGKSEEADVRILTHDGEIDLIEGQRKDPIKGISDHLPIMFRFRLPTTKE